MTNEGQIVFETPPKLYYYTMVGYNGSNSPWIPSDCNEIAFWNRGTSNVLINNVLLLQPLDFVSLPGHVNETDTTIYQYVFQGAGTNFLIVVKKTYK